MLQTSLLSGTTNLTVKTKTAKTKEELDSRIAIIRGILEYLHLDFRIQPLERVLLSKTAMSWNIHFDRQAIPTDRLFDVYYNAMADRDERTMFTPTTMITAWRRMVTQENERLRSPEKDGLKNCSFCKGKGVIMDFDKEIPCPMRHPTQEA